MREGRLEVCFSQRWGTVSSDGWSETEAQVVCRDLGYELSNGIANGSMHDYLLLQC